MKISSETLSLAAASLLNGSSYCTSAFFVSQPVNSLYRRQKMIVVQNQNQDEMEMSSWQNTFDMLTHRAP